MTWQGKFPSLSSHKGKPEKASVFASRKASITIEAAMAVPLFFLAAVCLFYLMEMMVVSTAIRSGLQYAGKMTAQESCGTSTLLPSQVEAWMVDAIGADRLERSIVEGGSSGLSCSGSYLSMKTGIGEIAVAYKIRIPVRIFRISSISREDSLRIKAWTGYEKGLFNSEDDEIVYVTETGIVYHKDYHCTHLELSIHMAERDLVDGLRNTSGEKYHACEKCGGGSGSGVYITDNGNRYHSSLT